MTLRLEGVRSNRDAVGAESRWWPGAAPGRTNALAAAATSRPATPGFTSDWGITRDRAAGSAVAIGAGRVVRGPSGRPSLSAARGDERGEALARMGPATRLISAR